MAKGKGPPWWVWVVVISFMAIVTGINNGRNPSLRNTAPTTDPSPTASPSASSSPDTEIGKTDANGVTAIVEAPAQCKEDSVPFNQYTFDTCLIEGLTYIQTANVFGFRGKLASKSGSYEIWQWEGGDGKFISVSFSDGHLKSKSQVGL